MANGPYEKLLVTVGTGRCLGLQEETKVATILGNQYSSVHHYSKPQKGLSQGLYYTSKRDPLNICSSNSLHVSAET